MDEEEIEQIVDKKFQEVIAEERIDQEIITTEIRKAVKGMRNKKAGDKNNQKTEWIKEGGSEMVQNLATQNLTEQKKRIKFQYNGGKQKLSQFTKEETQKVYKKVKQGYF